MRWHLTCLKSKVRSCRLQPLLKQRSLMHPAIPQVFPDRPQTPHREKLAGYEIEFLVRHVMPDRSHLSVARTGRRKTAPSVISERNQRSETVATQKVS